MAASMSSAPDTPILLRSMRWTTFRSLSMSPSLIDCSPTAKVPGEKLADPTLAMLCEELSRECHLLLREIDEAREVVWCYVSAGKPNAQLERTIDYVAACQVVEWGHKVIPLQRRVPAHDAAHAIGPPQYSRARCGTRREDLLRRRKRVGAVRDFAQPRDCG